MALRTARGRFLRRERNFSKKRDITARAAGASVRRGGQALHFRHKHAASWRGAREACSWVASQALLRAEPLRAGVASTTGSRLPSDHRENRYGGDTLSD